MPCILLMLEIKREYLKYISKGTDLDIIPTFAATSSIHLSGILEMKLGIKIM